MGENAAWAAVGFFGAMLLLLWGFLIRQIRAWGRGARKWETERLVREAVSPLRQEVWQLRAEVRTLQARMERVDRSRVGA